MTVTVHEAKTHLSRILHAVETGEEVLVCRGKQPVAKIVPANLVTKKNPPVGVPTSEGFEIPADAFAPMSGRELEEWGL
ncbi:MAG: type II toxin-antitoxin system prevent-host-death family antitoxin [Terrimicrobiaceae bacterium]